MFFLTSYFLTHLNLEKDKNKYNKAAYSYLYAYTMCIVTYKHNIANIKLSNKHYKSMLYQRILY